MGVPVEKIMNKRQDERDEKAAEIRRNKNIKTAGRDAGADRAAFRKA